MLKIIVTCKAPAGIGPYSQAIVQGGILYSSGQIPIHAASGEIAGEDIRSQAEQVMKNISFV